MTRSVSRPSGHVVYDWMTRVQEDLRTRVRSEVIRIGPGRKLCKMDSSRAGFSPLVMWFYRMIQNSFVCNSFEGMFHPVMVFLSVFTRCTSELSDSAFALQLVFVVPFRDVFSVCKLQIIG